MTTLKLSDVVPTTEGPSITDLSLDAFRAHMKRDPKAPKAFKIGFQNFYKRRELVAWNQNRMAVNELRAAIGKARREIYSPDPARKAK